jgi:hypothetical protein
LRFKDGAMNGAGISKRVIFPALQGLGLTWFSRIYGEFDDNMVMIAFSPETTHQVEKVRHPRKRFLRTTWESAHENEYVLTDQICAIIGGIFDENNYAIANESELAYQISLHDDCFFYIKPATPSVVDGVLWNVLAQHSFYLRKDVDWSEIQGDLRQTLVVAGRLQVQSDPWRQHVWIPQLDDTQWWQNPVRRGTVVVKNGKAQFRDAAVRSRIPGGPAARRPST